MATEIIQQIQKLAIGEPENLKEMFKKENIVKTEESDKAGILSTEILNVQNKRYYFDVKEHEYGRFLKLAETAQSGRKSRLVIPMYLVPEVEKVLIEFEQQLEQLPEFNPKNLIQNLKQENGGGDGPHVELKRDSDVSDDQQDGNKKFNNRRMQRGGGRRGGRGRNDRRGGAEDTEAAVDIKDAIVEKGRRRYYFNLKENNRGRYLRLKAIGDIPSSMAGGRRGGRRGGFNGRNQNGRNNDRNNDRNHSGGNNFEAPRAIILPASGVAEFRQIVSKLLKEYKVDEEHDQVALADKNIELNGTANDKLPASQRFSSKSFRKVIFLDAGENSRGFFARMTELQSSYRESVTVPSRHFKEIGEWFLHAAQVTKDDDRENNLPEKHVENGSGDAKVNGNHTNDAVYDDEEESSDLDVVAGNRRRQAASDSEE